MTVVHAALAALGILVVVAIGVCIEVARRPRWSEDLDETDDFRAKLEALRPR